MSLELVLLVPVLVLLTLFVLWAGRGGRAGLTADLAAEEAATAAALCCDEGDAGEPDRDALAADVLRARPGLEFLCVGGLRPGAAPDRSGGPEFVSEHWMGFDNPGARTGGVGVLDVRFLCESDGAVAPLRGLFPTVTFHGQASEVVVRQPRSPYIGFEDLTVRVDETADEIVFVVKSLDPVIQDVLVDYDVVADSGLNPTPTGGTVTMVEGTDEVTIRVLLDEDEDPGLYEDTERLVLQLTGLRNPLSTPPGDSLPAAVGQLDPDRDEATGEVNDDDPRPYLFLSPAGVSCEVWEGGTATFNVRLRNQANNRNAPSATPVTVDVETRDGTATAGIDYDAVPRPQTLTFNPGDATMPVTAQVLDDTDMPDGEATETFDVVLVSNTASVQVKDGRVTCRILDDEARVSVADVSADEGDPMTFTVSLDPGPQADVVIGYAFHNDAVATTATAGAACTTAGVDYLLPTGVTMRDDERDKSTVSELTVRGNTSSRAAVSVDIPDVTTCGDSLAEPNERFWLELSVVGGEAIVHPVDPEDGGWGTITDDDTLAISVDDASEVEGDTLAFQVGLKVGGNPATLVAPVTLDYAIVASASGTCAAGGHTTRSDCEEADEDWRDPATAGTDYEAASGQSLTGSLTFENACSVDPETNGMQATCESVPGATWRAGEQTVQVDLLADYLVEGDETFVLKLSDEDDSTHGLSIADAEATGTITDDPLPEVSVGGFIGPEDSTRSFTVELDEPPRSGDTVMVNYAIVAVDQCTVGPRSSRNDCELDGGLWTIPAVTGADYDALGACVGGSGSTRSECEDPGVWTEAIPLTGTVSFGAGETAKTVPVRLLADYLVEGDETFGIVLSNPVKAVLDSAASEATGTITDDPPPHASVRGFIGPEGSTWSFTVELDEPPRSGDTVMVDYAIEAAGTCTGGSGSTRNECEGNSGTWTPPATAGADYDAPGTCTGASGSTRSECEGDSGTWTVTTPLSGTVEFGPGEATTQTVPVDLLADTVNEVDETFRIVLSNPDKAVLDSAASEATGTITNVDPTKLTVNDPSTREGETLVFIVELEAARDGQSVTVDYKVEARSAKAGRDFTAIDPLTGDLTLSDSSSTATVSVQALNDTLAENDETLHLVLSNVRSASSVGLAKPIGVGTIENVNPASVRVSNAVAVVEGDDLEFVISLTDDARNPAVITEDVTVYYESEDADPDITGRNRCTVADADYVRQAPTSVTFEYDKTVRERTVTVETCTDSLDENDETMRLTLELAEGTANAGLADPYGVGTIVDAPPPALRIADVAAEEGGPLAFVVRLGVRDSSGNFVETAASRAVTVHAETEDGTALAPGDYTARSTDPSSPLTIPVGASRVSFTVDTVLDDIVEVPETMRVVLSDPGNALIDRAVATGTINPRCVPINDTDQPPTLTVPDSTVPEGGFHEMRLFFSQPLCGDFNITSHFLTGGSWGTATCGEDFAAGSTCLSEDGGQLGGQITYNYSASDSQHYVPGRQVGAPGFSTSFAQDDLDEDDEWLTMRARWDGMPDQYPLEWVTARLTIIDDDDEPSLSVADAAADEGDTMTFTVTLDAASGKTVTVAYSTIDGSGTAEDADYTAASGTLTFAPGDTSKTFTVDTATDADTEDDTFLVELSAPRSSDPDTPAPAMNAHINDGTAVGSILEGGLPKLVIADARGNEGSDMAFAVTLDQEAAQPLSVDYATVERPRSVWAATEGTDYTAVSGTLNFAVGDEAKTISVPIAGDSEDETDETFLVELSNASGASLADPSGLGTINGNVVCVDATDPEAVAPVLTIDSPTAEEGPAEEGPAVMVFTATFDVPYCDAITFWHDQPSGTATRGVDYRPLPASGNLRIDPLRVSIELPVTLIDDDIAEMSETIIITGRVDAQHGRAAPASGVGTIIDNDTASLSVEAPSVEEGEAVNFTVTLDRTASFDVTFDYATADGTATAGADYVAATGTATIPAGELSATVPVATVQDSVGEDDETFELHLSNPTDGVQLPAGEAVTVATIRDDDLPGVRISDAVANEDGTLTFTVTLDTPRAKDTEVGYSTRDGTATAGADYRAPGSCSVGSHQDETACTGAEPPGTWTPGGTLTFAAGQTTMTISVRALTDSDVEADELFFVDLASHPYYRLDDGVGVGTIRDINDRTLTVSDASVVEGGTLSFEVGFNDRPGGRDITVRYRTVAGTATAGDDYSGSFESAAGTLRILAGDTSATARVPTVQDALDEDAEQLELVLSDPVGGVLAASRARGVIIDDDPEPAVSVSNAEATENGDGTPITFTLSLSEPSGREVTVPYSTADLTGDGAATAGSDYVAVPDGAETISAGDTTATVDVTLIDDTDPEDVERFLLNLTDPTNAGLGDGIGVGTILDDDGLVQILADDAAEVYEGDGAAATFTVRLSEAAADEVTVDYSTADGAAKAGTDYTATSGTLTFAADETSETVTVALVNDDTSEDTETFRLVLSDPSTNARLGDDTAVATIVDDDNLAALSVGDASAAEGATASFAVSLSAPQSREVTVAYAAVTDPTAGDEAAAPTQDFAPVSGTLTIAARSTSATVSVALPDDSLDEHTETFWLRLSGPSGATLADGTGVGAIADNDPLPQISVGDADATEGGTIGFTVELEPASGRTVTVPWTTAATSTGNPASPAADYTPASGTLTFRSGTTRSLIEVATLQDDASETDETFLISLGEPTHATLNDAIAVGVIHDDDDLPRISIADTEVSEDDSPAIFDVTLSRTSSQAVTVDYATSDGTATAGDDYATSTGARGTLTIPAGLRRGEISVFVADDDEEERAETFHITLSDPSNAVIAEGGGTATATIRDDDSVTINIADAQASEGDGTIDFAVTLNRTSSQAVTVDYTTFDGSAVQPLDYTAASGTVTIAAGNSTATVSVTLTDDTHGEDDESFLVRLSNAQDAFIEASDALGTIIDDDELPVVSIVVAESVGTPYASLVVAEDVGSVVLEATLDRVFDREVRVDYSSYWIRDEMRSSHTNCPWLQAYGTLVFEPGTTSATFTVEIVSDPGTCRIDDRITDSTYFDVVLINPVNAIVRSGGLRGIQVLDSVRVPGAPQTVRLHMAWAEWVYEGEGNASVRLRLSAPHSQAVQVDYTISPLTATVGVDYANVSGGSLTIPANQQETTLQIAIVDDVEVEDRESFVVNVTSVTNAMWAPDPEGTIVFILDNDGAISGPGIRVSRELLVGEGSGAVTFSVYFPADITQTVTVDYSTSDGTAESPEDYTAVSGTLTRPPSEFASLFDVTVQLIDDDIVETDETFSLVLSNAVGATIARSEVEATIRDDDGDSDLPTINLMDARIAEGTWGTMVFTLSEESDREVTVKYRFVVDPELGAYAADISDFSNPRTDTARAWVGRTSGSLEVWTSEDTIHEYDERFVVELYEPVNAVLGTERAWVTIIDDDNPVLSIADRTVSESAAAAIFELELDRPGLVDASVDYTTAPLSSRDSAAIPDEDYTHTSGTVTFATGTTRATITVPIVSDDADEPDEMFLLRLSTDARLELDDAVGVGTIVDDDPGWTIDDQSVWEDPVNQGLDEDDDPVMVFNVERDHISDDPVTLNYRIAAAGSAVGGDDCDTEGVDFITPSGSVTLQAADTTATISITLCDDDDVEGRETLLIELTGVPGRKLTGTGTIISDDS